jgi:hypothetical protein
MRSQKEVDTDFNPGSRVLRLFQVELNRAEDNRFEEWHSSAERVPAGKER